MFRASQSQFKGKLPEATKSQEWGSKNSKLTASEWYLDRPNVSWWRPVSSGGGFTELC